VAAPQIRAPFTSDLTLFLPNRTTTVTSLLRRDVFATRWPAVVSGKYATLALKATSGRELTNTVMVFLSDMYHQHSFNPAHIQTRYNRMLVELKFNRLVEVSDLEDLYNMACEERNNVAYSWQACGKYIEYWYASPGDFHTLNDLDILVHAQK
jgi:hypothetical protein